LAGGGEDADGVRRRGERALQAALVGYEDWIPDPPPALEAAHHLVGIGELGDGCRGDEARRLDLAQSGVAQELDEAELVIGLDAGGFGLKAVTRTDLVDADLAGRHAGG